MSSEKLIQEFIAKYPVYLAFYICFLFVAVSVTYFVVR